MAIGLLAKDRNLKFSNSIHYIGNCTALPFFFIKCVYLHDFRNESCSENWLEFSFDKKYNVEASFSTGSLEQECGLQLNCYNQQGCRTQLELGGVH